jgi:hypothetical protein
MEILTLNKKGEKTTMKKIIIYFIIGLLIFVLTVLKWHNAYAQKDSIIYQEEPVEISDYKPKVFSWSWSNGRNHVIVTPETPQMPVLPRFTPDIQFYFDGKEFDRRMHKLEDEMERMRWHFRRDIQKELRRIKIDTMIIEKNNRDTLVRKIIIEKPHKRKEITIIPQEKDVIIPPNPPYRYEKRIEIRDETHNKNRQKQNKEKQDKKYIQDLENKVQQLEKRLEQLEKNNPKQK